MQVEHPPTSVKGLDQKKTQKEQKNRKIIEMHRIRQKQGKQLEKHQHVLKEMENKARYR